MTQPGKPFPLGATVMGDGANFALFSKNCTAVELLLFDGASDPAPSRVVQLDRERNRTFYYWHVFVPEIRPGQLYGYHVHGPYDPNEGHYFDGNKVLLDPYTQMVAGDETYSREAARHAGTNYHQSLKSVVVDPDAYDWEGDRPLSNSTPGTVIYELHVRGFTRHPNSGVHPSRAGTFAGVIEKIPYLKDLGIDAVELLPVQQFDIQEMAPDRINYWGYGPVAFFAPHRGYSSDRSVLGPANEFRDMVKALHRAGIAVILDVVFNHTAEGNETGPTLSFRGLENRAYYIPAHGRAGYADYTGCGNTVNGNQSIVRRLIVDCLRYWVEVMHVDGFRFDLASVLARDESGRPLMNPPVLWEIESDPVLAGTRIIAEAWDARGLNQVGRFVGHRWSEWNSHFRDDVRRFVKGDPGMVRPLTRRLTGNTDIYSDPERDPSRTINFVTCHDGFTLRDLVSYNRKHNEANGEDNRDGSDVNHSWNCGVEGETGDPVINGLRLRQMKNLLTMLFIAQGTPMIVMGDEIGRTQRGNNNPYCQDNEVSWFDWDSLGHDSGLRRFVRELIRIRRGFMAYSSRRPWSRTDNRSPQVVWHGVEPFRPDLAETSHSLAMTVASPTYDQAIYVAFNTYWEPLRFRLPPTEDGRRWRRVVDTLRPAPEDLIDPNLESSIVAGDYLVEARSAIILMVR